MRDWARPLFDLDEVGAYCQSAICPCGTMNKVAMLLNENENHGNANSVSSITTTFLSFLIDIPCCFTGITASRAASDYWNKRINGEEDDESDGYDDHWSPHDSSSNDCLPLSWCNFYTMGAFESCCSTLCMGPRVSSSNFPPLFLCAAGCIYPLCICPTACMLRRLTISQLGIDSESIPSTCAKSLFCIPCSLVQVHEELQNSTPFQSHPQTINNMS
jgi:hypothetical protein